METHIQEVLEELLKKLNSPFRRIRIERREPEIYRVNIESEEPSIMIGKHGENINALQNIFRTLLWKKNPGSYSIILDIDDYRKRQEDNVIELAERKVNAVRKTQSIQALPPMSSYFRRLIHLHLASNYNDIETQSEGEGEYRYLTIRPKTSQAAEI